MSYLPAAAHRLFARQHGAASLEQLEACGLSRNQVDHFVKRGALFSSFRGAYRTPSAPNTELSRCAALCLAHPHAVIAGPTAGRVWELRKVSHDRRIHLIAPRSAHPSTSAPGVVTFHTDGVRAVDVEQRADGIRVTSRARTAMDLCRLPPLANHRSIIEQCAFDGHLTNEELLAVADDITRRSSWVRRYLHLVSERLEGNAESHAEIVVGDALVELGVHGLVRQFSLALNDRTIRFDLAVPDLRWAIEVDVHPTHEEAAGAIADQERDHESRATGWTVSRLSRHKYENDFDAAIEELVRFYASLRHRAAG